MQIGGKENYFRNLTAKVWANLDNPIKSYDFQGLINFLYAALSGGTLLQSVMSQQYNCLMELYPKFLQYVAFDENIIFPQHLYLSMLGLR